MYCWLYCFACIVCKHHRSCRSSTYQNLWQTETQSYHMYLLRKGLFVSSSLRTNMTNVVKRLIVNTFCKYSTCWHLNCQPFKWRKPTFQFLLTKIQLSATFRWLKCAEWHAQFSDNQLTFISDSAAFQSPFMNSRSFFKK